MTRKGKEPAGLRRYRLEQKQKKAGRKARRAAPKRSVTMARRRSSRRKSGRRYSRKSKSVALGAGLGSIVAGGNMVSSFMGYTDKKKFFTDGAPIAILTGFQPYNNWKWSSEDFMKGGGPIVIGVVGGAIARKLPVIKSIPRQIPVIGKYIRW